MVIGGFNRIFNIFIFENGCWLEGVYFFINGWVGDISSDFFLLVVIGVYFLDKELIVKEDLLGRGNRSY